MNNDKDIIQEALNYDVAIEIIARLRSEAIRRKHAATTEEERQAADAEIKAYNADESVLNGYVSDDARISVHDKVFKFYAPILSHLEYLQQSPEHQEAFLQYCQESGLRPSEEAAEQYFDRLLKEEEKAHTDLLD